MESRHSVQKKSQPQQTTGINLRNKVKWAKIIEGCCVVFIIVWNKKYVQ